MTEQILHCSGIYALNMHGSFWAGSHFCAVLRVDCFSELCSFNDKFPSSKMMHNLQETLQKEFYIRHFFHMFMKLFSQLSNTQ